VLRLLIDLYDAKRRTSEKPDNATPITPSETASPSRTARGKDAPPVNYSAR